MRLTWVAPVDIGSSAITGYSVTTSPGGQQTSSSSTTATITGLTNGTSYSFEVEALNSAGAGPESGPSVPVTPATTPGAPTSVVATAGFAQALVTWVPPTDTGGSPLTGFAVISSPRVATVSTGPTLTSAAVSGLTDGTSYTFTVVASNALGNGSPSASSNAVVPVAAASVPGAPTNVRAVAGDEQATVTWSVPANDGGSAIIGYKIKNVSNGATLSVGPTTTASVTGLADGTSDSFIVAATNAIGTGAWSSPSNAVTPLASVTAPGAPTDVVAVAGDGQATVSWTAPASSGGGAITGYTVVSSPGDFTTSVMGSATTAVVSGLTDGRSYTFRVTATNSAGTGPASAPSAAVTPMPAATAPGPPTDVVATAGDGQATVSWLAPASDGGSLITRYTVTSQPGGLTTSVDVPATSVVVSDLTNGTSYTFTVTATNAVGTGAASDPSGAVTPMAGPNVPGAPTDVTAVAGDTQATVSWTPPADDGGSAITGFTVLANPGPATASASATATSASISGLIDGTSYTFTVVARNAVGSSAPSAPSSAVVPVAFSASSTIDASGGTLTIGEGTTAASLTIPAGALTSAVTVTMTQTTLACPMGYDCFSAVYDFEPAGTAFALPVTVSLPFQGSATTAALFWSRSGGLPGYERIGGAVQGSAVVAQVSHFSQGFTADGRNYTDPTLPTAPTAVGASGGDGVASVTWTAPASEGASPILEYTVTSTPGGLSTNVTSGTTVTVTGLTNGTTYTFVVSAINAEGTGPASAPSNAVVPKAPSADTPGQPTDVMAIAGDGEAEVTWMAPLSDGGSPITNYTVVAIPGQIMVTTASGDTTALLIQGLTNGMAYSFVVFAINSAGPGPESGPSASVTPATTPGAPTNLEVQVNGAQVTVSWAPPEDNGGSAVTVYSVTSSPPVSGLASISASAALEVTATFPWGPIYTVSVYATNNIGNGPAATSAPFSTTCTTDVDCPDGDYCATSSGTCHAQCSIGMCDACADPTACTCVDGVCILPCASNASCGPTEGGAACLGSGLCGCQDDGDCTGMASNPYCDQAANSCVAATVPLQITKAPIATASDGTATVSWLTPSDEGSIITSYEVTALQVMADGGTTPTQTVTTNGATTLAVLDLTAGTNYEFTVTATNGIGTSPPSPPSNIVTP